MYGQRGPAITHHVADPVDHRRHGLTDGADTLCQYEFPVVYGQQRLEGQRGAQPGGRTADSAAAPQVVQSVHDQVGVSALHGRLRSGRHTVQIGTAGGSAGGGQRHESGAHRRRLRVDDPHPAPIWVATCSAVPNVPDNAEEMWIATTPAPPLSANPFR